MKHIKTSFIVLALIFAVSCDKDENEDPNADLKEGLVAYYPFNGNTNDASGNNLNGTAFGSINYSTDRKSQAGKALELTAGNNFVNVADDPKLHLKSAMTIYLEFYPTSLTPAALVSRRNLNAGYQAFLFKMYDKRPMNFDVIRKDKCSESNLLSDWSFCESSADANILVNAWNYAAAVFDGTSQKIYLNGKLIGNQSIDFGEMGACSPGDLRIGQWWNSDPFLFKGKIDEVRIYDRALTSTEIDRINTL